MSRVQLQGVPTVSVAELRRNFGIWQERALAAPVLVLRHGKPRLVLCSTDQLEEAPGQEADSAIAGIPEHSSEAFLALDAQFRILSVNRVYEDAVGMPARQLIGQSWCALFPGAAEAIIGANFRQVLRTGQIERFETPSTLSPGRRYSITAYPHRGGVAALIVNRTTEEAMREALEESRSLEAIFEVVSNAGFLKINLRGLVGRASAQFKAITGYEVEGPTPLRFLDVIAAPGRVAVSNALESVLSGGDRACVQAAFLAKTGDSAPVNLAFAPLMRGHICDGATVLFDPPAGA